jgi:hypothetical protein
LAHLLAARLESIIVLLPARWIAAMVIPREQERRHDDVTKMLA